MNLRKCTKTVGSGKCRTLTDRSYCTQCIGFSMKQGQHQTRSWASYHVQKLLYLEDIPVCSGCYRGAVHHTAVPADQKLSAAGLPAGSSMSIWCMPKLTQ